MAVKMEFIVKDRLTGNIVNNGDMLFSANGDPATFIQLCESPYSPGEPAVEVLELGESYIVPLDEYLLILETSN